jgi:hypothetical protein
VSFIYDNTSLATKTDLTPIPGGADITKWFRATDYSALRSALIDTRSAVLAGRLHGFTGEATRPSVAGATRFLWVDSDDNKIYYYDGTTDKDLTAGGGYNSFENNGTPVTPQRTTVNLSTELLAADAASKTSLGLASVLNAHTFRDADAADAPVVIDKNLVATASNKALSITRQAGAVLFGIELGATDIPYLYTPITNGVHVGNIAAKSDRSIAELTIFRNQTAGGGAVDFMIRLRRGAPGSESGNAFLGLDENNSLAVGVTSTTLLVGSGSTSAYGTFTAESGLATFRQGALVTSSAGSSTDVYSPLTVRNGASGIAAPPHGTGILFEGKVNGGTGAAHQTFGEVAFVATDVTGDSINAYFRVRVPVNSTMTEVARFDAPGSLITSLLGVGTVTGTPSATLHAKTAASAAAATPVAILDKQSGGAVANNRIAEWYRDTSTVVGFLQSDASDNLAISAAANKALIFAVNGVTQASVTNTVTTINGAFRHAGSTLAFFSATAVARSATPFTLNSGTLAHDLPATGNTADGVAHVLRQLLTYLGDVSGYGLINVTA